MRLDRSIPDVEDKMSEEFDEDHQGSHAPQVKNARNDSFLRRLSTDSHEIDLRSNDDCKVTQVDGDLYNVYNDVKEHNSDAKCDTIGDGNIERITVDSSDHDDNGDNSDNDDNRGYGNCDDNDFIEVALDPSQFINEVINDHINDTLPVVSPKKDLDENKVNTNAQGSDNDFAEDRNSGQTYVLRAAQQKTPTLDISPEDIKASDSHPVDSGDESFDSFFDCVTLKQRSDPKHSLRVNSLDLNDTVETSSVVSKTKLSKLRNVIHERMTEGDQATSLRGHQSNNDELDMKKLNIPHGGPGEDDSGPSVLKADAVKETGFRQDQFAEVAFREHKYGTSYPFGQ